MTNFTHIVPLGSNCRNTHNLRAFFDFSDGYPFDWWIAPLPALVSYFDSGLDVDELYRPENLEEVRDKQGQIQSIKSRRFGLVLHHEFERDANLIVKPTWASELSRAKSRHVYLMGKFRSLDSADNCILFVRNFWDGDDLAGLLKLQDHLERLFPKTKSSLLTINYSFSTIPSDIAVDDLSVEDWRGDAAKWHAALDSTGYRLVNDGRRHNRGLSPEGELKVDIAAAKTGAAHAQ